MVLFQCLFWCCISFKIVSVTIWNIFSEIRWVCFVHCEFRFCIYCPLKEVHENHLFFTFSFASQSMHPDCLLLKNIMFAKFKELICKDRCIATSIFIFVSEYGYYLVLLSNTIYYLIHLYLFVSSKLPKLYVITPSMSVFNLAIALSLEYYILI